MIRLLASLLLAAGALAGAALAGSGSVVGEWRVYSARIYYDIGGGGHAGKGLSSRTLVLSPGGRWRFGSSAGTWLVRPIRAADWRRWGVSPYGPRRRIVLRGWNRSVADGPIEEGSRVDFLWVIYRVAPPLVGDPGTIWLKFGRVRP